MKSFGSWRRKVPSAATVLCVATAALLMPTGSAVAAPAAAKKKAPKRITFTAGNVDLFVFGPANSAIIDTPVRYVPVAPALFDVGAIRFPITGGKINPKTMAGKIVVDGDLGFAPVLFSGATGDVKVTWSRFSVDIRKKHDRNAHFGDNLRVDASEAGQMKVTGHKAKSTGELLVWVTDQAAVSLTQNLGSDFSQGLHLGTLTISGTIS